MIWEVIPSVTAPAASKEEMMVEGLILFNELKIWILLGLMMLDDESEESLSQRQLVPFILFRVSIFDL